MISLNIGVVDTQIIGLTDLYVIDELSKALSYVLDAAKFSYKYRAGHWDGRIKLLKRNLSFPTGCVELATRVLKNNNVEFIVVDKRTFCNLGSSTLTWAGHDLYDYQKKVVETALEKKCGMIRAATGSGKSLILSRIVYEYDQPTMVYVISLDLLSQMHKTLSESLGVPIGFIGNGRCEIEKINVCSAWTAGNIYINGKQKKEFLDEGVKRDVWNPKEEQKKKIKNAIEEAKVVILDESHYAAASSLQAILSNSKSASNKFGLSATLEREDGSDILLTAAFGDSICDIPSSFLINEGYLVQPKILFKDIPHLSKKIKKSWGSVKSDYITNNLERNTILIDSTIRLLDLGRKPLLLYTSLDHGAILQDMLPSGIVSRMVNGETSLEERDSIREDFLKGNIDLILGSKVFDTGIDLPNLDALILSGGGKSKSRSIQRIGRVIRSGGPEKKDALVIDTFDQCHYLTKHSIKRWKTYKEEESFKIKTGKEMEKLLKKKFLKF